MDQRSSSPQSRSQAIRDRRYAVRFPFAADCELLDLETGARATGVTSDVSLGGCFVCSSKPLPLNARVRLTLVHKEQKVNALAVVRIVKPRIGMGVEFIEVEPSGLALLSRWMDSLRRSR